MQPENATPKTLAQENAEKYATEKCNKILNSSISHFVAFFLHFFRFFFPCFLHFPVSSSFCSFIWRPKALPKIKKHNSSIFAFVCTFFAFVCLHVVCMFLEFLQLSKKAKNAQFQNLHVFCILVCIFFALVFCGWFFFAFSDCISLHFCLCIFSSSWFPRISCSAYHITLFVWLVNTTRDLRSIYICFKRYVIFQFTPRLLYI